MGRGWRAALSWKGSRGSAGGSPDAGAPPASVLAPFRLPNPFRPISGARFLPPPRRAVSRGESNGHMTCTLVRCTQPTPLRASPQPDAADHLYIMIPCGRKKRATGPARVAFALAVYRRASGDSSTRVCSCGRVCFRRGSPEHAAPHPRVWVMNGLQATPLCMRAASRSRHTRIRTASAHATACTRWAAAHRSQPRVTRMARGRPRRGCDDTR